MRTGILGLRLGKGEDNVCSVRSRSGAPVLRWRTTRRGSQLGRFIAVVGPDGVGKTSLARTLIANYEGCTAYVHFWPTIRSPLREAPPDLDQVPRAKSDWAGSRVVGWIRLLRSLTLFWMGYVTRVRIALRRGCLVVADRWGYGYYAQPTALGFLGPEWLARWAIGMLPAPDLIVNLVAEPEKIRSRKTELTLEQVERELKLWAALPVDQLRDFDASSSPERIAKFVMDALNELSLEMKDG